MKNSTIYKAWRVIIDSIEGVEVKEDTENNQIVAIKENNIVGLFDLELDAGSIKENKPGWMLKQDPVLAAKVKSNVNLAKKRQAAYGDPDWQKKQDEKKELAKESWLSDDYVTWVDDSSKAKTFTQAEAEIVAKQVNGLASPRFPDGEETDSYVVSNINQYESIKEAVSKSEIELVKQVADYIKTNKLRLPNPNYLETKFYSPQWKALGAYIYYQLPNKTIIAILNRATGETKFNPNGLHKPLI